MRKAIALLVFGAMISGCVTATIPCPADHQMTASSNAPDVATIASGLLTALAQAGVLAGAAGARHVDAAAAPVATPAAGSMTWHTLTILGNQNISCGGQAPAK